MEETRLGARLPSPMIMTRKAQRFQRQRRHNPALSCLSKVSIRRYTDNRDSTWTKTSNNIITPEITYHIQVPRAQHHSATPPPYRRITPGRCGASFPSSLFFSFLPPSLTSHPELHTHQSPPLDPFTSHALPPFTQPSTLGSR